MEIQVTLLQVISDNEPIDLKVICPDILEVYKNIYLNKHLGKYFAVDVKDISIKPYSTIRKTVLENLEAGKSISPDPDENLERFLSLSNTIVGILRECSAEMIGCPLADVLKPAVKLFVSDTESDKISDLDTDLGSDVDLTDPLTSLGSDVESD